jgi:hypothetical protein
MAAPAHNAATMAQGAPKKPSSAGAKLVVANKLPFPVRIRNFRKTEFPEMQRDGSTKMVTVYEADADTIVIHGSAMPRNGQKPCRVFMGYALTEGVDQESFERWREDNKDQNFIRNNLIFAMPNIADAEACARENEKRVTNMEPFDPEGDPRAPRPVAGMTPIVTATAE